MTDPLPPIKLSESDAQLIAAYAEGMLTDTQAKQLNARLHAEPALLAAVAQLTEIEEQLRVLLNEEQAADKGEWFEMMAELGKDSDHAEPVNWVGQIEVVDNPSKQDWAMAGRYVLEHVITSKRVAYAAAAVVLLVASLTVIILVGGPNLQVDPIATNPPETEPTPEQQPVQVVATLTDQVDAQWRSDDRPVELVVGTTLSPQQRLTLTHGFAQIATQRGATALLQAPCTIELTDSDNAIRLHAGKLVGRCESADSKGFTVQTPTAEVIDYGTEFGVEVGPSGRTHAAVFTGEVELSELSASQDQPTRNVRLTAGWSSQVSRKGALKREPSPVTAFDMTRYVKSMDEAVDPRLAYRRAVLENKPLVYWGFDERAESASNLAGLSSLDGKAVGQIDHGKGLFGSALQLTGNSDTMGGVASAQRVVLGSSDAYTLEAWVYAESYHWGRVMDLAIVDPAQKRQPAHLTILELLSYQDERKLGDRLVRFLHRSPPDSASTTGENLVSAKPYPLGQWVHLVAVKDKDVLNLYVNGEHVSKQAAPEPFDAEQPLNFTVGVSNTIHAPTLTEDPTDFRPFHGRIDEVALYNTALPISSIQRHFTLGQTGVKP